MVEWAHLPSLFSQWAHDWVLWPAIDAVFEMPLWRGHIVGHQPTKFFLSVSVSPTLGVVSWSPFRCDGLVHGCVGTERILCTHFEDDDEYGTQWVGDYRVVDVSKRHCGNALDPMVDTCSSDSLGASRVMWASGFQLDRLPCLW
ncbi:hypothetical protein Pelo_19908 [Pelomyxa schiedti]|nr:hypothetical protein Pelo_19908 [Pelomyxa schiedti]